LSSNKKKSLTSHDFFIDESPKVDELARTNKQKESKAPEFVNFAELQ
jgi:hypothetical protein